MLHNIYNNQAFHLNLMVRILEKIVDESPAEKKFKIILEISKLAGQEINPERISYLKCAIGIDMVGRKKGIIILPLGNDIYVYEPALYSEALRIATLYEKITGETFFLRKEY